MYKKEALAPEQVLRLLLSIRLKLRNVRLFSHNAMDQNRYLCMV